MTFDAPSWSWLDAVTGVAALPLWLAALVAAVLVVLLIRAFARGGLSALANVTVLAFAVVFAWLFFAQSADQDRAAERRALQLRIQTLAASALAPGSPLACLEPEIGDAVLAACERSLFATAESVAAAVTYVSARLDFLREGVAFAGRADTALERDLNGLRKALEADRYGFAAYVLAHRDGCTPDKCEALTLLRDPAHVRANLKDRTFDLTLARYVLAWPGSQSRVASVPPNAPPWSPPQAPSAPPPSSATPSSATSPAAAAAAVPGTPSPVPPGFSLPSAASIPPVSIMNAEPGTAQSDETGQTPTPRRRPAARPAAPVSLAPPAAAPAPANGQ